MVYNKYNFNYKKKKDLNQDSFIDDHQLFRFFISIYFNDVQFESSLIQNYNLTKSQIQKYSEFCTKLGYISLRNFSQLSDNMQEAIIKMTPDFKKFYARNEKAYIITPQGKEDGKELLTKALKQAHNNQSLQDLIRQLNFQAQTYRSIKKDILEKEKLMADRQIITADGIKYLRMSNAKRQLKQDIFELRHQKESNNTQLTIKNNTSLAKAFEDSLRCEAKQRTEYQGLYANIPAQELNNIMREVNDKDIEKLKKEDSKMAKEYMRLEDEDYDVIMYKSNNLKPLQKKKLDEEAMNFLNSL